MLLRLGVGSAANLLEALPGSVDFVDIPALLIMKLFDCRESKTLGETEFLAAISLIESYIVRRPICGYQTEDSGGFFRDCSSDRRKGTASDLKVALARQRESYRFPSDEEYERALQVGDLYGLRVCRHLLEGLENHETKEPAKTTNYSIEHIMPKNQRLSLEWGRCWGDWKEIQKTWLHHLVT